MAYAQRRAPSQRPTYFAVPSSPGMPGAHSQVVPNPVPFNGPRPPPRRTLTRSNKQNQSTRSEHGRGAITQGVATGAIGAGYGPYSYQPDAGKENGPSANSRFSAPIPEPSRSPYEEKPLPRVANTQTVPQYVWDTRDPDLDDPLHNPDPIRDAALDKDFTFFSLRGWLNASALLALLIGLIILFVGYPVYAEYTRMHYQAGGFNLGGINGSGQVPKFPNVPNLIDNDTPTSAYSVTLDGQRYNLVFSDEFNVDGRTFWPGDDPFWEAADLHYWPTGDLEWYDPQAITTANGKLVITLSQKNTHDLNFQSGMLTSWNKLCFTTGYIEVSVSMPGSPQAPGLWPAAWTMGNLGRAGYGATTEGMWPYSYDSCDVGTLRNQSYPNGEPAAAATGGIGGGPLSYLPGQRLSACCCPDAEHPGPSYNKARNVPEIDIIETQVDVTVFRGQVSQSYQTAPYNYQYKFNDQPPATTIFDPSETSLNVYKGGVFQQALSGLTYIDNSVYNDQAYAPYAFEWWSDPGKRSSGYITWYSNGQKTWRITSDSIGPDSNSQVGQRLIPEEPMYIILNLGLSPGFQSQDFKHLQFPSKMYIDYVRVYQREGITNGVTCDPASHPTAKYINKHIRAYTNPNLTTWDQAGFQPPLNSLVNKCV